MFGSLVILSGSAASRINAMDPVTTNDFPNYIWVYVHHHVTAQLGETVAIILFVGKYHKLRKIITDTIMEQAEVIQGMITR